MRPELKLLWQAIIEEDEAEQPECDLMSYELHAYIDAQLDGEDADQRFPAVAQHLESCTACQQTYEEVRAFLVAEREGLLVEPPGVVLPNLSGRSPRSSIWEVFGLPSQQVARLTDAIHIRVRQKLAMFGALPATLRGMPLAPEVRARSTDANQEPSEDDRLHQVLELPHPGQDRLLHLLIGAVTDDGAVLAVGIDGLSSGQPLNRARINLRDQMRRLLDSGLTENGRVIFQGLSPGNYLVEVTDQQNAWELPVKLESEDST